MTLAQMPAACKAVLHRAGREAITRGTVFSFDRWIG